MEAIVNSDSNIDALNIQIKKALELIDKGLYLISIEDFNTSGLFGQEPLRNGEEGYEEYKESQKLNAFAAAAMELA